MGDFTKKEYLLENARVESAIAKLAPVTRTSVLDAGEFLQDFGQIWRVATDEERKKLLGSTIDIAYILEGSIKPKPSMYNLLHATIGRDQPDKSSLVVRLRSRRGTNPHDVSTCTGCVDGIRVNSPAHSIGLEFAQ